MNLKDEELKVKSIRADDDTYEKFKKLATTEFGNQGQCLTALINLYETEISKVALVERKMEIDSFQDYLNKLGSLFLTSLQLNNDAEGRIRDEFARQLDSKDKTIENLQSTIKDLTVIKDGIAKNYNDIVVKNEESIKRAAELTESNTTIKSLIEEYKGKNAMLLGQIKQHEKYPEQLETAKALLADSQTKVLELKDSIKDKDFTINSLNKDIESSKHEYEKSINELTKAQEQLKDNYKLEINKVLDNHKLEIAQLTETHIQELERVKEKAEFDKEKALLDKNAEHQDALNKIKDANSDKVNALINEKEKMNEKISVLMEESNAKSSQVNTLDMTIKDKTVEIEKLQTVIKGKK